MPQHIKAPIDGAREASYALHTRCGKTDRGRLAGSFFSFLFRGRVPVVGSEMGHPASFTTDRPVVYWKSRTPRFLVLSP